MNVTKQLYQWDTGQKLTECTGIYVDYLIGDEVYRVEITDGTCIIPDELLQTSGRYKVWECMADNTLREFVFKVLPRPIPPNYVYTPTERLTFEGLVQKVDDAVADMIRRAESGEFDGYTPVKGKDYFTTAEIQQIQNEVSSGAIGEFKSVVDTETETFNNNAETKLTAYNQNDLEKTASYNANATKKLNAYNTNANNRLAEFDAHTEQIQTDISELKSDLSDIGDTLKFGYVPIIPTEYYTFPNTGKALADNGNTYDLSNHDTSDYIELKGLYGICRVVSSTTKYNLSRLAFYDKDKNFLNFVAPETNYEFDTFNENTVVWLPLEESAVYVRFDNENTRGFNYWIVYKEPEAKIFDEYCLINDFNNFVESVVHDVEGNNILNPSLLKNDGYYYDFNDGVTTITYTEALITENFIEVPYKELVIIKDFGSEFDTNIIALYFYDSDGNYINFTSTRYSNFVDNKWVVTLPANSTKIKVYTNNKNIDTSKLCISYTRIDVFEPYTLHKELKESLIPKEFHPLKDKVIVNFGDSIFGNKRPPNDISTEIANITGATVYNLGFGGCRMSQHGSNWDAFSMYRIADAIATNDFSIQDAVDVLSVSGMPSYFEETRTLLKSIDFNNVDTITIAYGTNDFTANVNLDSDSNIYDTTTFAGVLRYSIEKLLGKYPHLKIFVCGQAYRFWMDSEGVLTDDSDTRTNSNGAKLTDFVTKTKDVSKDYHLKFIDNYYELGINKFNRSHWFPSGDGTHHNELGGKLMAEHMANELY